MCCSSKIDIDAQVDVGTCKMSLNGIWVVRVYDMNFNMVRLLHDLRKRVVERAEVRFGTEALQTFQAEPLLICMKLLPN